MSRQKEKCQNFQWQDEHGVQHGVTLLLPTKCLMNLAANDQPLPSDTASKVSALLELGAVYHSLDANTPGYIKIYPSSPYKVEPVCGYELTHYRDGEIAHTSFTGETTPTIEAGFIKNGFIYPTLMKYGQEDEIIGTGGQREFALRYGTEWNFPIQHYSWINLDPSERPYLITAFEKRTDRNIDPFIERFTPHKVSENRVIQANNNPPPKNALPRRVLNEEFGRANGQAYSVNSYSGTIKKNNTPDYDLSLVI